MSTLELRVSSGGVQTVLGPAIKWYFCSLSCCHWLQGQAKACAGRSLRMFCAAGRYPCCACCPYRSPVHRPAPKPEPKQEILEKKALHVGAALFGVGICAQIWFCWMISDCKAIFEASQAKRPVKRMKPAKGPIATRSRILVGKLLTGIVSFCTLVFFHGCLCGILSEKIVDNFVF